MLYLFEMFEGKLLKKNLRVMSIYFMKIIQKPTAYFCKIFYRNMGWVEVFEKLFHEFVCDFVDVIIRRILRCYITYGLNHFRFFFQHVRNRLYRIAFF